LAIEIDGPIHDVQMVQDAERQEFLETYGSRVLRFSNHEVINNMPAVLVQIRQAVKSVKL
jgi:leucyl-tRNA synthetase